ncbi:class I SAM-dependent methyltransferase [Pseudonocardiaceae bacterium YIM PH 21723]|nr:class I SAM-dependent methyltransferase [Pseudonocardiaceae bacterium YIM PH 21723]
MDAATWDDRYAATDQLWSVTPNRFVEEQLAGLPPGRALDLACGEGRNAAWLADKGWQVTAVDFSAVAVDRGRTARPGVDWQVADVLTYRPQESFDLVLIVYLQLPEAELAQVLGTAARALSPGGTLLVVGHDRDNLEHGTGGPQDPAVLYTAAEITAALPGLRVLDARQVLRPVEPRSAIDTLVRAVAG